MGVPEPWTDTFEEVKPSVETADRPARTCVK